MEKAIEEIRSLGIIVTNDEVESVKNLCCKKIEICKIQNPEEYMKLLFPGELKNYVMMRSINEASIAMIGGK